MSFDWTEFLRLARILQGGPESQALRVTSETRVRCAFSRAYYAAFCYARNHARDNMAFTPSGSGDDHWLVPDHYKNKRMPGIADTLKKLGGWRKQCDYDDAIPEPMYGAVGQANERAERLIELLRRHSETARR